MITFITYERIQIHKRMNVEEFRWNFRRGGEKETKNEHSFKVKKLIMQTKRIDKGSIERTMDTVCAI